VIAVACTGIVSEPGEAPGTMTPPPHQNVSIASESGARFMSQAELDNTLFDLVGDDTRPASRTLIEDLYSPYDNDYTLKSASEALITGLEALATDVADRFIADPARRDPVVGCTPTGPGDEVCFRQFVESFVAKALRRPLEAGEADRYMPLLAFATEDNPYVDNDFYTAVGLVVRAVIQDPEFLYRIEVGTSTSTARVFALSSYEIATRMAYLIWGTTPDDMLLADAATGILETAEGRRATAARMLADPKARGQMRRFHSMWLGYRTIPHDATLVTALNQETGALIDRVVFDEPQPYLNIFTSNETYVDDFLASHYGLPAPAGGAGWVSYDGTGRAGILSHGSVLAAFSKFTDTSPTQRGILVRTRLMCQVIPPPPPTVNVDEPPGMGEAACKVDRYRDHTGIASCAACHARMDEIGFGLENYDMAGRFREADDDNPACTIDGVGTIEEIGTFTGPAELANMLIDEGYLEPCVVEQYLTFAQGRKVAPEESVVVDELVAMLAANGGVLSDFIVEFVASERFALRAEEAL
jgi:hypothetical protein